MIQLKRAYEAASKSDGLRILVERLWPRGINKEKAAIDLWMKDIAPSTELRTWFGHDPGKWRELRKSYWAELRATPELVAQLRQKIAAGTVTFVFAASDAGHNSAVALKEFLERRK